MARRRTRAESRARYFIRSQSARRGWNLEHPDRGGDVLEENEIAAYYPDAGLASDRPDFIFCLGGLPEVVVEAKNDAAKLQAAVEQAQGYAETINAAGRFKVRIAVGAAGEEDAGFVVETRFLTPAGWIPLQANGLQLTAFPSRHEADLAVSADDGSTDVTVPASEDFIDAAVELSRILRTAKIEPSIRPKVIGAITAAMYQGQVDVGEDDALASVNALAAGAIRSAADLPKELKDRLIDALTLSQADFSRLAPSIRRVVAILRRLNVRAVLQTDTDFLGLFYEAFLRYGFDNNALGIVFTPRHITRFCVDLIGVGPQDRVIDVASGTGGFLVGAFDRMMDAAQSNAARDTLKGRIHGFETNPTVWALSMLNMFFRGDGKSNMVPYSCLLPESKAAVRGEFSRAFLNPPFSQEDEPERDFLDAAMAALEPNGLLAAVVYAGVFADDAHKSWREQFLRQHSLLGMVSLPEDLFYPTAAPTTIVVARAHVPQADEGKVLMARVWNDGYRKLKSRRVERGGSQLPEVAACFSSVVAGDDVASDIATVVLGSDLAAGVEWSPQEWLPQPHSADDELASQQAAAVRATFQAVARFPDLSDEVVADFPAAWSERTALPVGVAAPLFDFFEIQGGRSLGESAYGDGTMPYISSGGASNSVVRLVSADEGEAFSQGAVTVTAFGTACLQPWPFVGRGNGGSAVRVLTPRYDMSVRELVWFVAQINLQRWRFLYARQAIQGRLKRLVVEAPPQRLPDGATTLASRLEDFRESLETMSDLTQQSPSPVA